MLQVSRTLAQQQQLQQAYGSLLKLNLSDGGSLVPPPLIPEWGFDSGRHTVWMNDIYRSRQAVWGKLVCCSHQTLTASDHCRSCRWVLTRLLNTVFKKNGSWHSYRECIIWPFLYFSPPSCRFITRFVRTHWSILGWALRSVSNCKLKCHFTFLQTLVTSGSASSAGCIRRKVSERLFSHHLTFRSYSPVSIKCHSWGFSGQRSRLTRGTANTSQTDRTGLSPTAGTHTCSRAFG